MKARAIVLIGIVLVLSAMAIDMKYVERMTGTQKGDRYGTFIAPIGDINGDGFNDVAIAAPGSYALKDFPGKVFIHFGGAEFNKKADIELTGEAGGDLFGTSVTGLGDINGDKIDDFAVGAPRNDGTYTDAGKVYIFYGGKTVSPKASLALTGARANDWFGISIVGGKDISGDNLADLLIGSSYAGSKYSGAVYVFLGGGDFGSPALTIEGEKPGDNFGQFIIMPGDISADGTGDFVVSASYADAGGVKNSGATYLFKGGAVVSKTPWVTLEGKAADENFGYSLANAGDINKDGVMDFIVGSIGGGPRREGTAFAYLGGQVVRPQAYMEIYGDNPKDMTGRAVSTAGDMNNDGYGDIMVGSPYSDDGFYRNGRVDIYLGGPEADILSDYHILGERPDAQCGYWTSYIPNFYGKRGGLYLINCAGKESGFNDFSSVIVYK